MRLRFVVAFAAVGLAWYVTRPGQASNAARVDVPARAAMIATTDDEAPRPVRSAPPPPALPSQEPEAAEPAPAFEPEPHAPPVMLDRSAIPHVARIRWEETLEHVDTPASFARGAPVEHEPSLVSPSLPPWVEEERPPEVEGHQTVYYVEGIDLTGLTFE